MGKTKARRPPNNRLLVLGECEALIIGPAGDSALERASAVFCWGAGFGHSSTGLIRPAPDPGRSADADGEDSIVKNHVEQRFMNPDATVVFNKAELAKAIHEEADA
jgi:hypothetical protein